MSRSTASLVMVCLLPLVTVPAGACSLAGCADRGIEMRSDFAVKIRHADKPLPGSTVEIAATVTAVEGRKVLFAVTAKDEIDTISSGSHARFVVDKAKTIERLKAKAAKLRSA